MLLAVAAVTAVVIGYQVLSARDPENVSFENSRSAAYVLAAQHCRQLECEGNARQDTAEELAPASAADQGHLNGSAGFHACGPGI